MASHDSLPPHTHGSVPGWWLTLTRARLSGLPILALLGTLILNSMNRFNYYRHSFVSEAVDVALYTFSFSYTIQ